MPLQFGDNHHVYYSSATWVNRHLPRGAVNTIITILRGVQNAVRFREIAFIPAQQEGWGQQGWDENLKKEEEVEEELSRERN